MKPFAIAGMQLHLSGEKDNLAYMESRLGYLMHLFPWVQMVVFSELAACGPSTLKAQPIPGPTERKFQELAHRHKLWLINGSIFELFDGKIYNTLSVIDPEGRVVDRYRKIFPFRPYEMDVESGDHFCVFDVPDAGRFGVSICYDMWFPETTRTLVAMGAEVILHPTMTTTIDRDAELAIVRATAAMNQCYVIDINGVGDGGNGRSVIVAPAGDVMHEAGAAEELMPLEIDFDRVRRGRAFGVRGLGQPLKSFRDCPVTFNVYNNSDPTLKTYFDGLGPLERPQRGSKAGITPQASAMDHPGQLAQALPPVAPLRESPQHTDTPPTSQPPQDAQPLQDTQPLHDAQAQSHAAHHPTHGESSHA
jgi:predicted amidohydrolase